MNLSILLTLAEKDLHEVAKNRIVVVGAAVLAVIFAIGLPLLIIQIPIGTGGSNTTASFEELAAMIPQDLIDQMQVLTPRELPIVLLLGYLMAPLFLVLPLMLSCMIAAEAFVGEKERKTLEALLYTPATDAELFTGKVLASVVPGILYAWASFAVYAIVTNGVGFPVMGRIWFPTGVWWVLMLWVTPAVALLGVSATVLISSRVSTFLEAYQTSGILVVVIIALMAGQMTGLLFISPLVAFVIGCIFFVFDAGLIWLGIKIFSRSELISRI
ncbi:MAG: ABC transporter permease subunit [Methanomicrobiales archaeon]|nr:ABC transporter permease subunit [Methanomicrobiales archaeon]